MLVENIGRIGGPAVTFDRRVLEYLIFIAKKYGVTPQQLLLGIRRAWSNGSSECGRLKIQCIIKAEERPHFRIICDKHIVTQTKVNVKLLIDITDGNLRKT